MSFKKTFCSSPWFHMRINSTGTYEYCRWVNNPGVGVESIKSTSPLMFFQHHMTDVRQRLLSGESVGGCNTCYVMEQNNKISGRQRQLLKTGIQEQYFEKTLASSPLKNDFDISAANQGQTTRTVSDWQIDLGNFCNNACVFCMPSSSSRLALEFKKIGLINELPPKAWCDDPATLQKFIDDLLASPDLRYLHFIGGETLITPAFQTILEALLDHPQRKNITIGFTTNLNSWSQPVIDLLCRYENVNLGMSVETMTPINEYVRWPSKLDNTKQLLGTWIELAKQHNWFIQLRTTPTCLTVHDLTTVYDYAWEHGIAVESCNFLSEPAFMKIDVLPTVIKQQIRQNIQQWLNDHDVGQDTTIINTRHPGKYQAQLWQDLNSYTQYIDNSQDLSHCLPQLVTYLKQLESSRDNSIIDYLPQYEELFRSAGY